MPTDIKNLAKGSVDMKNYTKGAVDIRKHSTKGQWIWRKIDTN